MKHRWTRWAGGLLVALSVAGCAAVPAAPSSPPPSLASSYGDFADGFCAAFQALFRAVGNPDTGEGSDLSDALEAAAERGDATAAAELAARVIGELEQGRDHAAYAGSWEPGGAAARNLDLVLAAFAAWAAAKVEEARRTPGAANAQAAFEAAGGLQAWTGMLEGMRSLAEHRPAGPAHECTGVPVSF